jgi:hypothetical protein
MLASSPSTLRQRNYPRSWKDNPVKGSLCVAAPRLRCNLRHAIPQW